MVKSCVNKILVLLISLLGVSIAHAQDLLVLEADPSIKKGVLANGTSYYIVSNSSIKGVADFALVQKTGLNNIPDTVSARTIPQAREALSSQSRCLNPSVQTFFTSKGVTPGKDGFVKVTENSTEFRFGNVLLSKPEVLDSALLVIMSIVDKVSDGDEFVRNWYSPDDQAVIVAGDIDADSVESKLKMLSLMTAAVPSSPRKEYIWKQTDTARYIHIPFKNRDIATFSISWKTPRTPKSYMNTIQPVISEIFISELCLLAERRVKEVLRSRNIPFAEVSATYVSSENTSSDEVFTVTVSVADKDFNETLSIVSSVMADIDSGNTSVEDLNLTKNLYKSSMYDHLSDPVQSNAENVDKCAVAFLYGGSLATQKARMEFVNSRQLSDSTELKLFNNISAALIDSEKNMTLSYSPDMDAESVRNTFVSSWKPGLFVQETAVRRYTAADIPMYEYEGEKIKIKTDRADHISGGREWVFSTGFKVVYKKMNTNGKVYFNLALNSGFGSVADISKGEGAYFTDYFQLSKIKGIPAEGFFDALSSAGITMDTFTSLSYTMVTGSAPKEQLPLLFSSLLHVMNSRTVDEEHVGYYNDCEQIRSELRKNSIDERYAIIADIMCPGYNHSIHKNLKSLSPDLLGKTEKFFRSQSGSTDDGVLIILGDIDESLLKKSLLAYVGGFRTSDRVSKRSMVRYQPVSGTTTYTVPGEENSVDIALSIQLPLTADNFMTAEVSAMVLKKMLSEAVLNTGMYMEFTHECKIYPSERLNIHISLKQASAEGFASDVEHTGPIEAMAVVRSLLSGISDMEINEDDVNTFKEQLKNRIKHEMTGPQYWMNVISRRHLAGKDFTSGYKAKIDSVDADKVKNILSRLKGATGVEYIISEK